MSKTSVKQLAQWDHEGGIVVRKVIELWNPDPFYLVTLLEEPPEVSSTRWPNSKVSQQALRAAHRAMKAAATPPVPRGVWEVKVYPFRRPTGILCGDGGQIVDELWTISPWWWWWGSMRWFGTDDEALRVCIEYLRRFDVQRRMGHPVLIP